MGKIKLMAAPSGVERLLHPKLKPSLPARKSAITQILQERKRHSIKLLGNIKENLQLNQDFKFKNVKFTNPKKRQPKPLVYKVQAAKHGRKLAARVYDLKKQFRSKIANKKDSNGLKQTLHQIPGTPIDRLFKPEFGCEIYQELRECIDNLIDIKIMKVMTLQRIHVELQHPLQFVTYTAEPQKGRRFECDLTKTPTRWELLCIMQESNKIMYNDLFYLQQKIRRDSEVSSICKRRKMIGHNPYRDMGVFLMGLSCFALMCAVFGPSLYGPAQPFTYWDWFLSQLYYYLRIYFYIDINSY